MTAPRNGPNGFLGDRIHQLPAILVSCKMFDEVHVWPEDVITKQVFQFLNIQFTGQQKSNDFLSWTKRSEINTVICLYADPGKFQIPTNRQQDCGLILECDRIARILTSAQIRRPRQLNPVGNTPLWKELVHTARLVAKSTLPALPFLVPSQHHKQQAKKTIRKIAGNDRFMILSPLSGGEKQAVSPVFWRNVASEFNGKIIVPVYKDDVYRAKLLFKDHKNVIVLPSDIAEIAALSSIKDTPILGVDGGPMNLLAASRAQGVLSFYGNWPSSAWALPNVKQALQGIRPKAAILAAEAEL